MIIKHTLYIWLHPNCNSLLYGISDYNTNHLQRIQKGRLRGLAVACWTTDHYHPCSNPGVDISEGCFVFDIASLPLEFARPIQPTMCTKVAVKHQSSSSQRIQNSVSSIVIKTRNFIIIPILQSLKWLLVRQPIYMKILLTAYKPISDLTCETCVNWCPLESHSENSGHPVRYYCRCQCLGFKSYGDYAFSVAAPTLWTMVVIDIRNMTSLEHFKSFLKTHLFKIAFTDK